jgi:ankyrin repeat protein
MDNNESNFYDEYVALSDALRSGNLYDARELIELQPNAVNVRITALGQTALHIAVVARHLHKVEVLVDMMWEDALEIKDYKGNTARSI